MPASGEVDREAMRAMVLTFAADVGRRCVDAITGTGLTQGLLEDRVDAGGVEWEINVHVCQEHGTVRVKGHPVRKSDPDAPGIGIEELFRGIFGGDTEESFDFLVPVAWLPQVEAPRG